MRCPRCPRRAPAHLECMPGPGTQAEPRDEGPAARVVSRTILAVAVVLAVVVGLAWYVGVRSLLSSGGAHPSALGAGGIAMPQGALTAATPPMIGRPAPDFALLGTDGTPVRLSDLRGTTVVLNFWATWCVPCKQELPVLVRSYQANAARGLVVLGVDVQERPDEVRAFAAQFSATYPMLIDSDASVVNTYRLFGLPTTWFIDRGGVLRAQQVGPLDTKTLAKKLHDTGFDAAGSR